jgi:hypothetical protein
MVTWLLAPHPVVGDPVGLVPIPESAALQILGLGIRQRSFRSMTQPSTLPRFSVPASARKWTSVAVGLLVVCLVTACYGSYVRYQLRNDYHGNYSGFLQLSEDTFDSNPLVRDRPDIRRSLLLRGDNGYDGQFMYYMTFDPFMRRFDSYRTVVDYPPYRFGRIGFSGSCQ